MLSSTNVLKSVNDDGDPVRLQRQTCDDGSVQHLELGRVQLQIRTMRLSITK
jgi:hypothetical protein